MFEDNAYIAGFFDGEGTLSLGYSNVLSQGYRKDVWVCRAACVSTDLFILEFIKDRFGGNISPKNKQIGKACYQWYLSGPRLNKFLHDISPFLKIKQPQAKLLLEFRERMENNKSRITLSDEEKVVRMKLISKNKSLNQSHKIWNDNIKEVTG